MTILLYPAYNIYFEYFLIIYTNFCDLIVNFLSDITYPIYFQLFLVLFDFFCTTFLTGFASKCLWKSGHLFAPIVAFYFDCQIEAFLLLVQHLLTTSVNVFSLGMTARCDLHLSNMSSVTCIQYFPRISIGTAPSYQYLHL